MKKNLYLSLMISLGFVLSNCAHKIPDEPICLELEPMRGYCTYTLSDKHFYLLNEDWVKMKSNSLIMPIESWGEIKKFILKICADENQCTDNEKIIMEQKLHEIEIRLP